MTTTMLLFNRDEIVFRSTGQGYIDDEEEYVAAGTVEIPIKCNIQPYREGKNSFNTPTGYRTIDAIEVRSCEPLQAADEIDDTVGDQLIYNGKEYFCKNLEIWEPQTYNSRSLIPVHYLGYFFRKDES